LRRSTATFAALCSVLLLMLPGLARAQTIENPVGPTALTMTLSGGHSALAAGSWISATRIALHFQVHVASGAVTPQVEIQPAATVFTGKPNVVGPAMTASGTATLMATGLTNGSSYHWQARVADGTGNASPWVTYSQSSVGTADFRIDRDAPSRPTISSPTDPIQSRWYNTRLERLQWDASDALSGVQGYSYVVERRAHVIPPGTASSQPSVQLRSIGNGIWFVAVRAVDRAGNWSPTATFRLQLDRVAPRLSWLSGSRFTFNPYRGAVRVRFRVSKTASVHLKLFRVGSARPTATFSFSHLAANHVTTITWSGKRAHGRFVPQGYYFFAVSAVDHANNVRHWNVGGMFVHPARPQPSITGVPLYPDGGKRIIVSLSREALYAYDGSRLVMQTLVTTGNPSLPTPLGSYTVLEKLSPFEFISPWPPGSPDWYAPSWVRYAMLFQSQGYFLHDAPWRSHFGPGSNGPGQPGTDYGGTHGCVNVPIGPMTFLWNWAPTGTRVQIVP
jgi:L,D-transpeptidase catalytic domain